MTAAHDQPSRASLAWAGGLLGFSLGGFFDGILLHQVLQWHHLLSAVEAANRDIRTLVLADGLFHLAMYAFALAGLVLLWRARSAPGRGGLLPWLLAGFGAWHVVDALVSHWILGIHRIRMDVSDPLLWDLGWLAVFGLVPLAAAWVIGRNRSRPGGPVVSVSPLALAAAVLTAGAVAALPSPQAGTLGMVVFHPGVTAPQAFDAVRRSGARIVWTDPSEQVWAIDMQDADWAVLYAGGALLVGGTSFLPAGCLGWFRADA